MDAAENAVAKHDLIRERTNEFVEEVLGILDDLDDLSEPSADPHTEYVEVLRGIARVGEASERHRDLIAAAAHREPNGLSIPRIAEATGLAVNTVRVKLPTVNQGRRPDAAPPF